MILVDTSVWVWHFRDDVPELRQRIEEQQVLTHPLVIGELACGNLARRAEVLRQLQELPQAPNVTHPETLAFIERHRLMGRGINYVDVQLLASAVLAEGAGLWSYDLRLAAAAERLSVSYTPD